MRTDPRPAEVRSIVMQAFACFLGENGGGESDAAVAALPVGRRVRQYGIDPNAAGNAVRRPGFTRIYDPESDSDRAPVAAEAFGTRATLEIDETVLIDQGRYVARSYRAAGYMAMWLVPVGIVQFYDGGGEMLGTVNLFEALRPKRMAA